MDDTVVVTMTIPTDDDGMLGRQCPSPRCGLYFKLKPGTGLLIEDTGCPYCGTRAEAGEFLTADQLEYAKSVAMREVLGSPLRDFKRNIERLNRPSRDALIGLRFSVDLPDFGLHSYQESEVETPVTCTNCALEFAVFGVFATCPDCGHLNAFDVFDASLEVCHRRLRLLDLAETAKDEELLKAILVDSLGSAVAAFDALGKKLRKRHPSVFPAAPKNLFQNLGALDAALIVGTGKGLAARLDGAEHDLIRLFQVRHVYEHNLGVVDDEFVNRVPFGAHLTGKLYPLTREDVEQVVTLLAQLALSVRKDLLSAEGTT